MRKADLLTTVETTEQALEASELFFQYYRENANYLERTYDFVERLGIEKVRKETVYATDAVKAGAARSAGEVEGARARRVAGRADATQPDAVRARSGDGEGARMKGEPLDTCDRAGEHPRARRAGGAARGPRDRDLQSRRSLHGD